mgnify:CR=1 FL=1
MNSLNPKLTAVEAAEKQQVWEADRQEGIQGQAVCSPARS